MLEIKAHGSIDEGRFSSLGNKNCEEALARRIEDAMRDYHSVDSDKFSPSSSPRRKTVHDAKSGMLLVA